MNNHTHDLLIELADQVVRPGSDQTLDALRKLIDLLGNKFPDFVLENFNTFELAGKRVCFLDRCTPFSRTSDAAKRLGRAALNDPAYDARFSAAALLAYSLDRELLPHLKAISRTAPAGDQEYLYAAIDAIQHQNHNYFMDKDHSGKIIWNP